MEAIQIIVQGNVQGVFFRASAKKKAALIGITGWVKNTKEGHVEMKAQGDPQQIQEFLVWCKQGPPSAKVESVTTTKAEEDFTGEFKILHQ
ncbi:MAG: acylphosphatase [Chitinophagaceae bacterium]